MTDPTIKVLLEMRPALDGYAGIPQETRLLYRGLARIDGVKVCGLIQESLRALPPVPATTVPANEKLAISRLVLALESRPTGLRWLLDYLRRRLLVCWLFLLAVLFPGRRVGAAPMFPATGYEEFFWSRLFSKSLLPADFSLMTSAMFRVCRYPWNVFQSVGLWSRFFFRYARYPLLDTRGIGIFIAQTPYPGRVPAGTRLVIRYHDTLPVFMPHAFANMRRHFRVHVNALRSNIRDGAYFVCVSEATRQSLLYLYPEMAANSCTIHNMVSPHYVFADAPASQWVDIVANRVNLAYAGLDAGSAATYRRELARRLGASGPCRYLLMVSSIEPRKNHLTLLAAWQALRQHGDDTLRLVVVGGAGWGNAGILAELLPWAQREALFVLNGVPASELRVLYRLAEVTVCPSLAEGFDFSGVEALCSGGRLVASDIPVHHEVFGDEARYFASHDSAALAEVLARMLSDPASAGDLDREVVARRVGEKYSAGIIVPQWEALLARLSAAGTTANAAVSKGGRSC